MMTCPNHPNVTMEILPAEKGLLGTRMRCPLIDERTGLRCPRMYMEFDEQKVDIRHCARCGERIRGDRVVNCYCKNCDRHKNTARQRRLRMRGRNSLDRRAVANLG